MFTFCGSKQCPKCGFLAVSYYSFCPNCGAKLPVNAPTQEECPMCRGTGKITPYIKNVVGATNTGGPLDHQPD